MGGETPIVTAAAVTGDNMVVRINTGTSGWGRTIPQGFCGTSHEWGRLADYCNNEVIAGAWMNIFRNLGPKAVLRVGGFSTEALTAVSHAAPYAVGPARLCTASVIAPRRYSCCTAKRRSGEPATCIQSWHALLAL
jgi:hypothetical protein